MSWVQFGVIESPMARKEHVCDWCVGPIVAGERYQRWVGMWAGDPPVTMKMHTDCVEAELVSSKFTQRRDDEGFCEGPHQRAGRCSECSDMPVTIPKWLVAGAARTEVK